MKLNTYNTIILNLIERMVNDGYSESRISKIKGLMNKLSKYLLDNDIKDLNEDVIVKFVKDIYNFDYYNPINNNQLNKIHCYNFINNLDYSLRYKEELTYEVRRIVNWLYDNNKIDFDGHSLFPRIVGQSRSNLISYYDNDEIEKLLNCVDITTSIGKRDYLILSILVYLGLRISDVVDLKLSDINWNLNTISIVQQKTQNTLTLPLIDEVKYPLLDYLKNVRKNLDEDYIFITNNAPIGKYNSKSFWHIVTKYMDKANIDYTNKHHGTHSLRHSLASNLLKDNTPITTISSVLGHSTIKTTQKYLTIDVNNLKELSLEVNL